VPCLLFLANVPRRGRPLGKSKKVFRDMTPGKTRREGTKGEVRTRQLELS